MGFSVSGSFAILVVAAFISFGMFYSGGFNGMETIRDANTAVGEDQLVRQNTEVNITRAELVTIIIDEELVIETENEGSTTLSVNETDVIVDNHYVTHTEIADDSGSSENVDGDSSTNLWQPGETYSVTLSPDLLNQTLGGDVTPSRVKIVTEPGVADSRGVS